jgi:general secretion pathway protein A
MYEAFYGLKTKPFQLNPDPSFYFASKQHRRAKAYLEYGVSRNEGFIVITGEIGAGKTMVLRSLIDGLVGSNVVTGHLVTTQLGAEDTLRMVGAAFGFRVKDVPKSELLITLEAFLISQTSKGKRCLLVVDEAQNLTPRAVEELRMLSNFQFGNQALLQSFLVGQPEFREILQRPEMEQFRQRVAATCHIGPLDAEETRGYIEHRLKCAGSTGKPSFDAEAFGAIHAATQGIPRRVNAVCDRLLLAGFLSGKTHLTATDVAEVVAEFDQEAAVPQRAPVQAGTPMRGGEPTMPGGVAGAALDLDLSRLHVDGESAEALQRQIQALVAEGKGDALARVEAALARLERVQAQTLGLMSQLVGALRRDGEPVAELPDGAAASAARVAGAGAAAEAGPAAVKPERGAAVKPLRADRTGLTSDDKAVEIGGEKLGEKVGENRAAQPGVPAGAPTHATAGAPTGGRSDPTAELHAGAAPTGATPSATPSSKAA